MEKIAIEVSVVAYSISLLLIIASAALLPALVKFNNYS